MYKYNPFIMQNIRANTLIIGANNNPINKKVRLNADFSINYKKNSIIICSFIENLKSASNLNGNLNCSKELEHYAS